MVSLVSAIDARTLEFLYAHRDLYAVNTFLGVSAVGDAVFVAGLVVCIAIVLMLRRHYAYLLGLFVSTSGAAASMYTLKHLIERARPPLEYQAYIETGFSLPSGHATIATVMYGFCIYMVWRLIPPSLLRTIAVYGLFVLIAAIVFSRLYLGVHYLSDVLAGVALGGIFVWIGIIIVQKFENKR